MLHPYSTQADKCSLEEHEEATVRVAALYWRHYLIFPDEYSHNYAATDGTKGFQGKKIFQSLGSCPCTVPLLHPSYGDSAQVFPFVLE